MQPSPVGVGAATVGETSPGLTIGAYLIDKLQEYGVKHVFGVPGDYVLGFYDQLQRSAVRVVGVVKEDGAGFAADAYARLNGVGACCITYCVGGLSVANAIAGAYAEKSPVIVISGSPGLNERLHDPMLHHKVRSFNTQRDIFAHLTELAVVIDHPDMAFRRIDEAFRTCVRLKRPVYIELPRDMVDMAPTAHYRAQDLQPASNHEAFEDAVAEIVNLINAARQPVILADVEIHRYGLQTVLRELVDRTGIPVAATLLGKSVIEERHPRYLGVYEGAMGREEVARFVEDSDCVLALGAFMTDINLGIFTARLDPRKVIQVRSDLTQVHYHRYVDIPFEDMVIALSRAPITPCLIPVTPPQPPALAAPSTEPLRVEPFFHRLNTLLRANMAVVCDVGLSLFGAIDLIISRKTEFIAPAYYTSMGFGVPAAIGVSLANRQLRPVVIVGDGAFQMTGLELATAVRLGLDPIVIVLNNHGYTTERAILDGPYNDVLDWNYAQVPELLGSGRAWRAPSEQAFVAAWAEACANVGYISLIEVELDPYDYGPALERLGKRLAEKISESGGAPAATSTAP